MATRSFIVRFFNETPFTCSKVEDHLDHGDWTEPNFPPAEIPANGAAVMWESESSGDIPILGSIGTGTEGHVIYRINQGSGDTRFLVHWDNPFIESDLGQSGVPSCEGWVRNLFQPSPDFGISRDPAVHGTTDSVFNFSAESDAETFLFLHFHPAPEPPPPPSEPPPRPPPPPPGLFGRTHSSLLLQSSFGHQGNFELVVPQGSRLVHYTRDNDTAGFPWHHAADLVVPPPSSSGGVASIGHSPVGVTVIESNIGDPGNLEAVVRMTPILPNEGDQDFLASYFFDCSIQRWAGPFLIRVGGQPITGVTGTPALIQSRFGQQGNFELVVPQGNRLVHYTRDNDAPGRPWNHKSELPVPQPGSSGHIAGINHNPTVVCLLESNFGSPGNLEAVVRMTPVLPTEGAQDFLVFYFLDGGTGAWNGPFPIIADGVPISGVTGMPGFVQSRFGQQGNFELVVPQGNRLVHYFRDNDAAGFPWHKMGELAVPEPSSSGGIAGINSSPVAVALLESSLGSPGNLEAVVRMSRVLPSEDATDFLTGYFMDTPGGWHGPFPLRADGHLVEGITGG